MDDWRVFFATPGNENEGAYPTAATNTQRRHKTIRKKTKRKRL